MSPVEHQLQEEVQSEEENHASLYAWALVPMPPTRRRSGGRQVVAFKKQHQELGTQCSVCNCTRSKRLTIDHIFPRSQGGSNRTRNLLVMCHLCNEDKGALDPFVWYVSLPEKRQTSSLFHMLMKAWKNHMVCTPSNDNNGT